MQHDIAIIEAHQHGRLTVETFNSGKATLTHARNDVEAISAWLAKHADSPHTLAAYRKEAERFVYWLGERGRTLKTLAIEDVIAYAAFIKNPQPREKWCLELHEKYLPNGEENPLYKPAKKVSRYLKDGSFNPEWKPFVKGLSDAGANQTMVILFGLGEFLAAVGYLALNPFRAAKRKAPQRTAQIERYLDKEQVRALLSYLENMPAQSPLQLAKRERAIFVVRFLYLTGLRRAELVSLTSANIQHRRGKWWLRVLGKGKKLGDVPLPQAAMACLNRYRQSLGLGEFEHDGGPVLRDVHGKRSVSVKALHALIVDVMKTCPDQQLRKVTAHWFRHSAATNQLEAGIPLATVRDNLRHSNISTTSNYLHTGKDKRHSETELHSI